MATETNIPIVGDLLREAESESAASKMLADAKTVRQADRDDYPELASVGYDFIRPEQTTSFKAAAIISKLVEALDGLVAAVNDEADGEHGIGGVLAIKAAQAMAALSLARGESPTNPDGPEAAALIEEMAGALREAIALLDDCEIAHPLRWENMLRGSCDLGTGCDEAGVCCAAAHDEPERCARAALNQPITAMNPSREGWQHVLEDGSIDHEWVTEGGVTFCAQCEAPKPEVD